MKKTSSTLAATSRQQQQPGLSKQLSTVVMEIKINRRSEREREAATHMTPFQRSGTRGEFADGCREEDY